MLNFPQVHNVSREGEWLSVVTSAAEPVVRELLAADSGLRELEVRRAGLAEALHTITGAAA